MEPRPRDPFPYWGWAVLSCGLGATILMKSATTPMFAAGWTALVAGLVVAHRAVAMAARMTRPIKIGAPRDRGTGRGN